ncbi:hypothetical protein R0137_09735 [Congregibacter brevis]|uniref:Uncharacterized protein n=1 Tax=Congregibacter brevis TaxID=3081201 RepID=A0ABZ0IAV1_9GAMM|nr:hypothetical protein R0137_09735 [Congregibacter sp. IMCC45268]
MGRPPKHDTPPAQFDAGWLNKLDGRRELARSMKARRQAIANDLGGLEQLSTSKRILIDRALFLLHQIEIMEQHLVEKGTADVGKWGYAINTLAGLLGKLGLERESKEITLHELMAARSVDK